MAKFLDVGEFPIEKIYLVSGGVEQGLDVIRSSIDQASDKTLDKVFLLSGANRPEVAIDISSVTKLPQKK